MRELITLTQRHLLEEYSMDEWVWADRDTFEFFKKQAQPPAQAKPKPKTPSPSVPIMQKAPMVTRRKAPIPPPPTKEPEPVKKKTPPTRNESKAEKIRKDFRELRTVLSEKAPNLKIIEEIPPDADAKRIANAWKDSIPEVAIIVIDATKSHLELLEKIAAAIQGLGYTSKVLIGEQQWERLFNTPHLKLALIPRATLDSHPEFKTIQNVKVCPLLPINIYLEKFEEKAVLWKQICKLLND